MNKVEQRMLEILKRLREEHGVLAIKSEFEAEGSRTDELVMLNQVVFRADSDMFIKIGGCEAVRDLDQCIVLGAKGVMAPMIETPFAMGKFIGALEKVYDESTNELEIIINAETKTCYENLDEILEAGKGVLNTVVVGRVDFSSSYGLTRKDINGDFICEKTLDILKRSRQHGYKAGFGGGISLEAIPFIVKMSEYADKFETRKVVFPMTSDEKKLRAGIVLAMEFETLYLRNKCDFYDRMAKEDAERLVMLEKRLAQVNN
ncbi:MAG: aldolase/citrate lyase family protein [Bacillota bacterium]|nr:aldolase/citrate lyase family protein [Bacillota bacterium]